MSTGQTILLIIAFLAAPVCLLAGVGAGACIVWRVMKGQSPLPTLFKNQSKIVPAPKPPESDRPRPPKVGA
jgi:hypothetical protein